MENELEFTIFKNNLITFCKSQSRPCSRFISKLESCHDESAISSVLYDYADDVYEWLGGEVPDEYEIKLLKEEVIDLEDEVYDLKSKLEGCQIGNTLGDLFKMNVIKEYYNDFLPWELEEILKNAKNAKYDRTKINP